MLKSQKTGNVIEDNKALKRSRTIVFNFDAQYLQALYYGDNQKRGGKRIYSSRMFECLLTIKVMFKFPWRAVIGFAEKVLEQALDGKGASIPGYSHASRECNKLDLEIKPMDLKSENLEICFESTGIKVRSSSSAPDSNHGKERLYKKPKQWKKVHIAIDLDSMQVVSKSYTDGSTDDR